MASQLPWPAVQLQACMQSGPQRPLSQAATELGVTLGELHSQVVLGQGKGGTCAQRMGKGPTYLSGS